MARFCYRVPSLRIGRMSASLASMLSLLLATALLGTSGVNAQQPEQPERQRDAVQQEQPAEEKSAEARPDEKTSSHVGEFVSAEGDKFTMTIDGEKQHSHALATDAQVSIDGQPAKLSDLKEGDRIKVTTPAGDRQTALGVAAIRRQQPDAQQPDARQPDARQPDAQQPGEGQPQPRQAGTSAALDIMVQSTPNDVAGVRVSSIRVGGSGELAGLSAGDYILSYNGEKVSSPQQLRNMVAATDPSRGAELEIWRRGRRGSLNVDFTAQAATAQRQRRAFRGLDDEPQQAQAWLGITLEADGQKAAAADGGMKIARIFPSGPAARAGLRTGDVVAAVDGREVTTPDEFQEAIDSAKPGAQVELVIQREGDKTTRTVALGQLPASDAFSSDIPEHAMMLEQHRHIAEQHQRIERLLNEVLTEVQQLRQEVNPQAGAPRGDDTPRGDDDPRGDDAPRGETP